MELKIHTLVSPKFVLGKIKFKVLHYVQHDSIRQCLGLIKGQTSMFKSFVIKWLLWSQIMKYFKEWMFVFLNPWPLASISLAPSLQNIARTIFFSIIITMYIDSLITNILKIKVNKARQHRTQNLQKTCTTYCKFCT